MQVDVVQLIDSQRMSRYQYLVVGLAAAYLVMDGFDIQAIGYAAPSLLKAWHMSRSELAPVFSASVVGMLAGSLLLSPFGDRYGRRLVIIAATFSFAVFMAATALAHSTTELMVWRFASGLGPGCVLPNAMALASEYTPRRLRVTALMIVGCGCGFGIGGAAGGALSAWLIPLSGWRAVFFAGATFSVALTAAMLLLLPESIQFLLAAGRTETARARIARLFPGDASNGGTQIIDTTSKTETRRAPVIALFRDGLARRTVLLWIVSFANLLDMYFLANWLPVFMHDAGYVMSLAVLAGTVLWGAGVAGNLTLGRMIDRFGFRAVLVPAFLVALVSIAAIGSMTSGSTPIFTFIVVFISGFCVIGGQPALNALAATMYPTNIRSTGIGMGLGVGRLGSIVAPFICGGLLQRHWTPAQLFIAAAIPAMVSAICLLAMKIDGHRAIAMSAERSQA